MKKVPKFGDLDHEPRWTFEKKKSTKSIPKKIGIINFYHFKGIIIY